MKTQPHVLILMMRNVPVMDASGLKALEDLLARCQREKTRVILCEVQRQPFRVIKSGMSHHLLSTDHIFSHLPAALKKAKELAGQARSPF